MADDKDIIAGVQEKTKTPSRMRVVFLVLLIAALVSAVASTYILVSMSKTASTWPDASETQVTLPQNPFENETTAGVNPFSEGTSDEVNPFTVDEPTNPFTVFEDDTTGTTGDYENPF